MARIDAHQHFWKFDPVRDAWINEDMHLIRRDFMPEDLLPELVAAGISGTIAVQADQSENETEFLLELSRQNDFIKGVVGWVDLCSGGIEERLQYFKQFEKIRGFRHVLQGEADRAFMLTPAFLKGISLLRKFGFTYDILIYPDQLTYSLTLCRNFPDQPFIIDHLAKPYIKKGEISDWKRDISAFKSCDNVYCKVSGIITEANWETWKADDIFPYLDVVVETFGVDRLVFGSDWPVCRVAGNYQRVKGLTDQYFSSFTASEKDKFYGGNATIFYKL
ncbi:amidohydrolase family protein [Flavihumibacter profundi]|uniref:amidohydrolase family protein n=1 Tax=Flavihumibacter profundi TaxID=2716883 RepID=UPI001CC3FD6B|nr:amidohydrolase family protein [Flavihumibacter profundi]MBZ5855930.1 amidohydrolase family protein [Flavihumibacter profundi]